MSKTLKEKKAISEAVVEETVRCLEIILTNKKYISSQAFGDILSKMLRENPYFHHYPDLQDRLNKVYKLS